MALPVWPEGRATEMNVFAEFSAHFDQLEPSPTQLRLTGATQYRTYVNGAFAGYGPARAGHGFYRVDEIDLTPWLQRGSNAVVIEVAGYNSNGYSLLDQPSFVQAEIALGEKVIAATGVNGFEARVRTDRIQKTQRYSFQRPFSEAWLVPGQRLAPVACTVLETKALAPRRLPYSTFVARPLVAHLTEGEMARYQRSSPPWKDRSLTAIGPKLKGFTEAELTLIPSLELQKMTTVTSRPAATLATFTLEPNSYRILDLGVNRTGFIGLKVEARLRTRLFVTDISQWEAVGRAHREAFADVCPAATMVEVARLIAEGLVVEIEADAVVLDGG